MARVRFDNVSKIYSRHTRQFFYRYLTERFGNNRRQPFHALSEVSFEVRDGESLAIIGHNGAGKSTLLNLVAGLTRPERGRVDVEGRVMALLELGSGFHPDLNGAENLQINASLCGYSKKEVAALFDPIVEFSELGDFIWEPLRTYSAGMVLRLAFSIAIHVDFDILLLDEVLVVGDKDFQKKCFARLLELKDRNKILLSVSHMPEMAVKLCDRALWIEAGRIVREGSVADVFDAYLQTAGSVRQPWE